MPERPGGRGGSRTGRDRARPGERADGADGKGKSGSPRRTPTTNHAELAGLGITLGLATALFALAGNWLDGQLGTKPLFVLLGAFLGFGGGFYSMYARLVLRARDPEAGGESDSDE